MNCSEFSAGLWSFFEQSSSDSQRRDIEAHAKTCSACGELLRVCREVTCREVAEFLLDYHEGRMPEERRQVFDRHLGICPDCTAYLDNYKQTIALGEAAGCETPEDLDQLPTGLISAILDANRRTDTEPEQNPPGPPQ